MSTTHWTAKPIAVAYSGSNINRDATFRYQHLTLWGGASINQILWDWQNGQPSTKIRLNAYNSPRRADFRFQIGDVLWINGYGRITVTDTDSGSNIWTDTPFDALQNIAAGTAIYQVQRYRFAEAGKTRLGAISTTGSIDISQGFKTAVQPSYDPSFGAYQIGEATHEQLRYNIISGSDAEAVWSFTDNRFSGSVAFVSSDTAAIPFAIGDSVLIEQEMTAWSATDSIWYSGSLAFTGSTQMPFPVDTQITVTGQSTAAYNGATSVTETGSRLLVTAKAWLTDSGVDNAVIYGYARPEYNTVATITNTFVSQSMRWVVTDMPWAGDSVTIPGRMRGATTTRYIQYSVTGSTQLALYGRSDYAAQDFTIADSTVSRTQRFASIYATGSAQWPMQYRDEAWLLAHPGLDNTGGTDYSLICATYDSAGNLIDQQQGITLSFGVAPMTSLRYPVGPRQLENLLNITFSEHVATYQVWLYDDTNAADIDSTRITFRYAQCGIGLTPYSIEWRDSLGSIASWPMQYVAQKASEVDRAFWMPDAVTNATLNTTRVDKWRLQSDFIQNDAEDTVIQDLVAAKDVWLKTETELVPVNIATTEYAYGNRQWGDLPTLTLDVVRAENVTR
jgi:hypothetical protein